MLPWNLRQLISYLFALINYSINLLKTARKTFATGNDIYPLPRTIIQITNDNSIFRKEGINGLVKSGCARIGAEVKYVFKLSKDVSHASVQINVAVFSVSLCKGLAMLAKPSIYFR